MPAVLRLLRRDHVNLNRLLRVFEAQLEAFDTAEEPDYDLMIDILDYCASNPDKYHHPLEDRVLDKLKRRDPEAASKVGDLDELHRALAEETMSLLRMADDARDDREVSLADLSAASRRFIEHYRQHIAMEEGYFFPAAEAALEEADWRDIENNWYGPADPVFGDREGDHYRRLRREVLVEHGGADRG